MFVKKLPYGMFDLPGEFKSYESPWQDIAVGAVGLLLFLGALWALLFKVLFTTPTFGRMVLFVALLVAMVLTLWLGRHCLLFGRKSIREGWADLRKRNWIGCDVIFMLPNGDAPNGTWLLDRHGLWARIERRDHRNRELNTSEFTFYVQASGREGGSQVRLARNGFPVETCFSIPTEPEHWVSVNLHQVGVTEEFEMAKLLKIVTAHPEVLTSSWVPYLHTAAAPGSSDPVHRRFQPAEGNQRRHRLAQSAPGRCLSCREGAQRHRSCDLVPYPALARGRAFLFVESGAIIQI